MSHQEILDLLPYAPPFLFVDEILAITEEEVKGTYTYREYEFFYAVHFKNHPVTPGLKLT